MIDFFKKIKANNLDCLLIGIKKFGKSNKNYLSFPDQGFTITVDLLFNDKFKNRFKKLSNELFKENFNNVILFLHI